jgi:hypothetical protein
MEAATQLSTQDERQAGLARAVTRAVQKGYAVEGQTAYQAVFVKGHRPNHVLHLILTLVTVGLWAVVWILVALLGGEKRFVVNVDEYGHVQQS